MVVTDGRLSPLTYVTTGTGFIEITVPKKLETPNRDRGAHWSKRHQATKDWERAIAACGGAALNSWSLAEIVRVGTPERSTLTISCRKERRRITVSRFVANKRSLIKDDDNLAYTAKPVLDSLKRLCLIYDDGRDWMEHDRPTQAVSPEGTHYTVIRIERLR